MVKILCSNVWCRHEIGMKRLTINHIRLLKYGRTKKNLKISDYEKYLINYVSLPTARKIIRDIVEFQFGEKIQSTSDKRVKYLLIKDLSYEQFL